MALVTLKRTEGVGEIILNRPPVNALSRQLLEEMEPILAEIEQDETVRAVLVTSAIDGVFVAGADLEEMRGLAGRPEAAQMEENLAIFHRVFDRLQNLPKPVVAAMSGHTLGGGLELALACDFRLMVDDGKSQVGLPETGLGLFPGAGGTQRLPRVVGEARALELILMARRLKAPDALKLGLIHEMFPPHRFQEEAAQYAARLARGATVALGLAKGLIRGALGSDLKAGLQEERAAFARALASQDAREGIDAFFERRSPGFTGK